MDWEAVEAAAKMNGIIDIEANIDETKEVVIFFNKLALDGLIEQLKRISDHQQPGGHVHLDYESGLEGNLRSIIIVRR